MNIGLQTVSAGEIGVDGSLGALLGPCAPPRLSVQGDPALLRGDKLGLFCSVRCPGDLILRAYDYAKKLRDDGTTVIGGFHSRLEKECACASCRGASSRLWQTAQASTGRKRVRVASTLLHICF